MKRKRKYRSTRRGYVTSRGRSPDWNDRFNVTISKDNKSNHPFYREYFDKRPKQFENSFRIKYPDSTNELPGITDIHSPDHTKSK